MSFFFFSLQIKLDYEIRMSEICNSYRCSAKPLLMRKAKHPEVEVSYFKVWLDNVSGQYKEGGNSLTA